MDIDNLIEDFEYDYWANRLWLEALERKGMVEPDRSIFAHALSASKIWLLRVQGASPTEFPVVELTADALDGLRGEWIEAIRSNGDDPEIHYRRTNGDPLSTSVSQIALHVVNHGTYHRGELRGLCRLRGDADFPETDRILFHLVSRKP